MVDWMRLAGVVVFWLVGLVVLVLWQNPLLRNPDGTFTNMFWFSLAGLTIGCFALLFFMFAEEKRLMSLPEWKGRAVSMLKWNHPAGFHDMGFEAQILDADGAALWVFREAASETGESQSQKLVAFGSLEVGGPILVSALGTIQWHKLHCNAKNILECYRTYRGRIEAKIKPLSLGERVAGVAQVGKTEGGI